MTTRKRPRGADADELLARSDDAEAAGAQAVAEDLATRGRRPLSKPPASFALSIAMGGPPPTAAPATRPGNGPAAARSLTPAVAALLGTAEPVALDDIAEPEWSGRLVTNREKDAELLASVREVGVIQPILVRPLPGDRRDPTKAGARPYERVLGSRRMTAARAAGLGAILAVVRELTDRQVAVLQSIENDQRLDVHALEQAESYRRMRDLHGMKPEEIATAIGKSRTWVYDRLRLCNLAKEPRAACLKDELEPSTAFLLSRYPKAVQGEVWDRMERDHGRDDGGMSYREVLELLRRDFQVDLRKAPFAVADALLRPTAGACTVCPRRTGNARDEYPEADIQSPDVCTDRGCYRAKLDAWNLGREAEHRAAGGTVLPAARAAKLFQRYSHETLEHNSGYRDLDGTTWDPQTGKSTAYRKLLQGEECDVVLARDPDGRLHELVDAKVADKAARRTSHTKQKSASDKRAAEAQRAESAKQKSERERDQRERAFCDRFHSALGAAVGSAAAKASTIPTEAWRVLLLRLLEVLDMDALELVAARRQLIDEGAPTGAPELELTKLARLGDAALLKSVLFEILTAEVVQSSSNVLGKLGEGLCTAFRVDHKAIRKQVAEQMKADTRAAKLAAPAPATAAADPGATTSRKARR